MTSPAPTSPRQERVDRFFRAAAFGAMAWTISLVGYLTLIALNQYQGTSWIWLNYAVFLGCFVALIIQYRNRQADEFTLEAWHAASSSAFFATVAWMLFSIQIEAYANQLYSQWTGTPVATRFSYWWAFQMPLTSFYAVFFYRQWRSS